jgi:L-threonylcarbamoyladenylate synthase
MDSPCFCAFAPYGRTMSAIERAAAAIENGQLVAYPTETVYGLGADALDPAAVERVFTAKGRAREKPVSIAVPTVAAAARYVECSALERRFMRSFLPGPITVVCRRRDAIPDIVTAGQDRVGVRIPDSPTALELLDVTAPITATSANPSGDPAVTDPDGLAPSIREAVDAVVSPAAKPATGSHEPSTVVDVERDDIHRRGAMASAVESWLAEQRA